MSSTQSPEPANSNQPEEPKQSSKKPFVIVIVAILLIIGGWCGYGAWRFSTTHVSTDDAQITSDVVPVSPQVSAIVMDARVLENQEVKAGDLIVSLDTSSLQAAYNQAKANLEAAISAANQAGVAVTLASETGSAQQVTASGVLSQADTGIDQAKSESRRSNGAVESAIAVDNAAKANITVAGKTLASAEANLLKSKDAADAVRSQLAAAKSAVAAAKATVDSDQAAYERASTDAERYAKLLEEGAVSAQTADNAKTAARQTKAQLDNANQMVEQAQAGITTQQANLNAANRQIDANSDAVGQAQAQIDAATAQAAGAGASVKQARAQAAYAVQGIAQAAGKREQALGGLKQAKTAPVQVAETKTAHGQAMAKIAQARASLETARIQLSEAHIYAPVSGRISKKTVEVGQYVVPGTPLLTIIPDNDAWVVANFKETQLADVRAGSAASVEVDGLPDKTFKGHVDSISAGTGATFALLPPDNATGNFTKVVQRIAVKIVLNANQPDYDRLRAGMSVVATINTK